MEEQLQHIKLLAFRYFEGKTSPEDAEVLFSFLKEGDFNPASSDGYIKLLKPLKDYEGQNCKILLEFEDK